MAVTQVVDTLDKMVPGASLEQGVVSQAGPASYASGGFAVDIKTDLGLQNDPSIVLAVQEINIGTTAYTYDAVYDSTNKKLVLYSAGTTTEVSASTDVSGFTFKMFFVSAA